MFRENGDALSAVNPRTSLTTGVKDNQDHGLHARVKFKDGMEDSFDVDYVGLSTHDQPFSSFKSLFIFIF